MNIDPITIILFLLFFVAPIVNNFLKRGQGDQGKAQRPSRPSSQPRPRDTSGGRTRADTSADTRSDTSTGNSGGFSQRLEEARRRVQEAMSEGQALSRSERDRNEDSDLFSSASQEQAQQTPRQSSQRTSTSSQGQTRQAFAGLGREGVSQRLPSQQGKQRSSQSATTDLDDAPPLRVQRLGDAAAVRWRERRRGSSLTATRSGRV